MPWQFFIALYFLFSVSRELYARWFSQRSVLPPQVIAALSFMLGVLPFGVVAGLLGDERIFNWEPSNILLLLAAGSFVALFQVFSYSARKLINVTLYLTLNQIYIVIAAVLGWALLNEKLSTQHILGGLLLLAGAYLAIYSTRRNGKSKSLKGAVFAILGGLSLGTALVAEKGAINNMNMSAYFIVGWSLQTVGTMILAAPKAKTITRSSLGRFELIGVTVCGLATALAGFSYINALSRIDNVSLAALLTTFNLPLAAVASHFILGERDNSKLLLTGATVSFFGLLVTAI